MADALPLPEKRKPLSKFEFALLFWRQDAKCAHCGHLLVKGQIIDEHLVPLDHLGSNSLSNRELWCKPCATVKTKRDLAASWKGKRLRGETKCGPKRPINGRKDIPKRGFNSNLTRGFDGKVRERARD